MIKKDSIENFGNIFVVRVSVRLKYSSSTECVFGLLILEIRKYRPCFLLSCASHINILLSEQHQNNNTEQKFSIIFFLFFLMKKEWKI